MTIIKPYKWPYNSSNAPPEFRPKVMPGFDRLDDRLQAALREQDAQKKSLKRKQAGGGQKRKKPKKAKAMSSNRRLLQYQRLYADNLQDLRRCAANKSNDYKFRSRPVPDFEKSHQLLQKRKLYLNSLQKLTKPKGPRTLVTSMEALKKRSEEERKRDRLVMVKSIPKINPSTSLDYMIRQPFKPRKISFYTRPKPFQLHTTQRAMGRLLYDEGKRLRMETHFENLANDWLKFQRKEYLKQRKLTNFKANPNPWRKKSVIAT